MVSWKELFYYLFIYFTTVESDRMMLNTFIAFASRLGYEEHIPGQTRDWNEELQLTREHPRKQLSDRLIRERAIFKVSMQIITMVQD